MQRGEENMARFALQDDSFTADFAETGRFERLDVLGRRPCDDLLLPELEDEDDLSCDQLLRVLDEGAPEPARWH